MNEYIAALFTGNESKAFGIIEPFYRTCLHDELPPSSEIEATEKDKKKPQSLCLCGFPTRTSGTSGLHDAPSAPECQGLLFQYFPRNFIPYSAQPLSDSNI
jgi:hypothetical protein